MPDAKPVRVPQETVNDERVRLVRWRVEEGAPVEPGAVLAEIETSKSVLEVTAGEGGFLRRAASEGDWVPVGGVFCYLTVHADDPVPAAEAGAKTEGPAFSRKARALLEKEGVDPAAFSGMGMVREEDVRRHLASASAKGVRREPLSARKRSENAALSGGGANALRSLAALRCSEEAYRRAVERAPAFEATPSGLILFEAARTLKEFPLFNAYYADGDAAYYDGVNVGFVVDGDRGLRVPVIHSADSKTEDETAREIQDLLLAYHEDELNVERLSGGPFTITDLSGEGVTRFDPLINAAQSAILGVAAPEGGSFELCLAFDHRLHEGRSAAAFLHVLKSRITARA